MNRWPTRSADDVAEQIIGSIGDSARSRQVAACSLPGAGDVWRVVKLAREDLTERSTS